MHIGKTLIFLTLLLFLQNVDSFAQQSTSLFSLPSLRGRIEPDPGEVFVPPIFNKTESDIQTIRSVLEANFLFQEISNDHFYALTLAFQQVRYKEGDILYRQGDLEADYMHIITEGECSIIIDGNQLPEPYGTMTPGSMLGELAMLYGSGRAATVTAKTDVCAYRLDRASFKYFLRSQPMNEEDMKAELKRVDKVIDKVSGVTTRYGGKIIRQFKPMRRWLWFRWHGTILEHAWKASLFNMVVSVGFAACIRHFIKPSWSIGMIPDKENLVIKRLLGLNKLWNYQLSLTTFILTFFLSQAYGLWREMYTIGRKIQGRLNDIGLLLASTVERNSKGKYTPDGETILDDVAAYSRLFHVFMWAKFSQMYSVLLTDRGMSRMLSRGTLNRKQYDTLCSLNANGGPHNACLMWILIRSLNGMKQNVLFDDYATRHLIMDKILELRSLTASIGDKLDGRIPLAYAHFVQVLVDTFLFLSPFALYSELGIWSTPAVGILTLFYSGLLDLSKILLDPLDNDEFYNDSVNMDVGVLIRESNAGSTRWKFGAETLPF